MSAGSQLVYVRRQLVDFRTSLRAVLSYLDHRPSCTTRVQSGRFPRPTCDCGLDPARLRAQELIK